MISRLYNQVIPLDEKVREIGDYYYFGTRWQIKAQTSHHSSVMVYYETADTIRAQVCEDWR